MRGRIKQTCHILYEVGYFLASLVSRVYNAINGGSMHQTYSARVHIEARDAREGVARGIKCVNGKPGTATFEVARIVDCSKAEVDDNIFDGVDSPFNALRIDGTTYSNFRRNRIRMQDDGAAREAVNMANTCTGTVFHRDNDVLATDGTEPRMTNTSTGGQMHTRAVSNVSGGKTRQIGDTIENTDYADTEALFWIKTAVSTAALDWKALTPT